MNLTKKSVSKKIRDAFQNVTLGNGVGLIEGDAIDDYADDATRKAYRFKDEKINWERIPVEALNHYHASLSFFDAEGMRFHLPAFLIAELNDDLKSSVVFHLTHLNDFARGKLGMLSHGQREAIREFLLFIRDKPDYRFDRPDIERELLDFWKNDEAKPKN
jgi:hypothetical protein